MNKHSELRTSIVKDLEALGLHHRASRLEELCDSPEFLDMGSLDVLRAILDPEYEMKTSSQLDWRLRRGHLIGCNASLDKCVDSIERTYSPEGSTSLLATLRFISTGTNVCLLGSSGSGKTYYAKALCIQACHSNSRAEYYHCDDLLDELASLATTDHSAARKRLGSLTRLPLLVLDDFLLYPTSDPTMQRMLFSLLERRSEARHSTIVCSQRNPEAWAKMLGDDAMAGAITSRATRGYVLRIDLKTETI